MLDFVAYKREQKQITLPQLEVLALMRLHTYTLIEAKLSVPNLRSWSTMMMMMIWVLSSK